MPATTASISYEWVIAQLDCAPSEDGLTNVVKTVHWRLQASEGTYAAECYGSVGLDSPEPGKFTDYDTLSKANVVAWLEAKLDVQQLKDGLANQIEQQKNPPIVSPALPWQS